MPFGSEGAQDGVGLALSGGGFRATLFHTGVVWRLNELGWLPRLDRISSVSGGSITAGALAMAWSRDEEQGWLINWGYALADAAVRDWVEESTVRVEWPVFG